MYDAGNEVNDSRATAVANLHMLMQMATGQLKPKKADEPQKRYEKVLAYLMTGACNADDEVKQMAAAIGQTLKQPHAAAA